MDNELWSIRNKLEDVQRALESGNVTWARMAAMELDMRLQHAESAWAHIKAALAAEQAKNDG